MSPALVPKKERFGPPRCAARRARGPGRIVCWREAWRESKEGESEGGREGGMEGERECVCVRAPDRTGTAPPEHLSPAAPHTPRQCSE